MWTPGHFELEVQTLSMDSPLGALHQCAITSMMWSFSVSSPDKVCERLPRHLSNIDSAASRSQGHFELAISLNGDAQAWYSQNPFARLGNLEITAAMEICQRNMSSEITLASCALNMLASLDRSVWHMHLVNSLIYYVRDRGDAGQVEGLYLTPLTDVCLLPHFECHPT